MFLALTSDSNYWNTKENILFLGKWCLVNSKKKEWEKLESSIFPYHWDDRDRFQKDFDYLQELFEEYIEIMSEQLNALHHTKYSVDYWRVVIGIWLKNLIDASYDRYLSISDVKKTHSNLKTVIVESSPYKVKLRPSYAFDEYNHYLYSMMIKELGGIEYKVAEQKNTATSPVLQKKTNIMIRLLKEGKRQLGKGLETFVRQASAVLLVEVWPQIAKHFSSKIVFMGSLYIHWWDQIKLQLGLGQLPYIYHGKKINAFAVAENLSMRSKINFPEAKTEYERVLQKLIQTEIPVYYVESYKKMSSWAISLAPKKPKAILTAYSMHYRECYEMWAAYSREKYGTKLLFSQHGGGYGISKNGSLDSYFLSVFDKYYSWGSKVGGHRKVKPMPSFRLYSLKKHKVYPKENGQILVMATTMPRYKIWAESGVSGPHMWDWIQWQDQFLDQLDSKTMSELTWRYFNCMWEEDLILKKKHPELSLQHGLKKQLGKKSDFISEVNRSKLCVHTANETTYLETLSANFPTIIFWNPEYYQISDSLKEYFQVLIDNEILFYDPVLAAKKVNQVRENPISWWQQKNVQEAREYFCKNVAYADDDYLKMWDKELRQFL